MKKLLVAISLSLSLAGQVSAEQVKDKEQVFNPDIARADVVVPAIDTESFELGAFIGSMRIISNSGNSFVYGGRFSYHINELFFTEASIAMLDLKSVSYINGDSVENTSGSSYYYNVSAGLNLLDGELFVSKNRVMPIQFYALAGLGQTALELDTSIDSDPLFTMNVGVGFRVLLTDGFALRMDIQDHLFDPAEAAKSDPAADADKYSWNNIEMTAGLSWYF